MGRAHYSAMGTHLCIEYSSLGSLNFVESWTSFSFIVTKGVIAARLPLLGFGRNPDPIILVLHHVIGYLLPVTFQAVSPTFGALALTLDWITLGLMPLRAPWNSLRRPW